ncbi:MAG: hypothetical protein ABSE25_13135 [Syntrophorhabdales bacterium]|jgi:hypothetical protein
MSAAERETAKEFVRLGREALNEEIREKFIDLLMERRRVIEEARMPGSPIGLPLRELEECLERELAILGRLERERRKLLKHMEDLSKNRNAAQKYRAKFPFPPLPVFFGKTT